MKLIEYISNYKTSSTNQEKNRVEMLNFLSSSDVCGNLEVVDNLPSLEKLCSLIKNNSETFLLIDSNFLDIKK